MTDGADFGALICNRVEFINFEPFCEGPVDALRYPTALASVLHLQLAELPFCRDNSNLVGLELQAVHFQSKAGLELLL